MTSRASISSLMRMAPELGGETGPDLGGEGHASDQRGDLTGVGEAAHESRERLGSDLLEALEALQPDLGAGEERHREDDEHHPAADDERAGADRDVADEVEEGAEAAAPEHAGDAHHDAHVEAELAADLLEHVAERLSDPAHGGGERHQNFWGTRAK